jgi:hypothetical protein
MPRNQQFALPLGQVEVPESLMRAAWERERGRLRVGFEAAMDTPSFRICLKHIALAMVGKGRKRKCKR